MITEDYVSFELAKKLKELGFNIPCYTFYDIAFPKDSKPQFVSSPYCHNHNVNPEYDAIVSAPTLSLVAKWLREEKNIDIDISCNKGVTYKYYDCYIPEIADFICGKEDSSIRFNNYEEALTAGITKALELIKE